MVSSSSLRLWAPVFVFLCVVFVRTNAQSQLECGGQYTAEKGLILSPNYPRKYSSHVSCRWEINVEKDHVVKLTFYSPFHLEEQTQKNGCSLDKVTVFDVLPNGQRSLVGVWCGSSTPPEVTSRTSKMIVEFTSDSKLEFKGFSASWMSVVNCGGILSGNGGEISSPNYPRSYPSGQTCSWDIWASVGEFVELSFNSSFHLGSNDGKSCDQGDYIEIFDMDFNWALVSRGKWCKSNSPIKVKSLGFRMLVEFHSVSTDNNQHGTGFHATWAVVNQCAYEFNDLKGFVFSSFNSIETNKSNSNGLLPITDGSQSSQLCQWKIKVPTDFQVRITLNSSRSSFECGDLMIKSSASGSFQSLCIFRETDVSLTSHSNEITMLFNSSIDKPNSHFYASWNAVCGGMLETSSGQFSTPNYPDSYQDNLHCHWEIITQQRSHKVRLQFERDFDLEPSNHNCSEDYVEIFDTPEEGLYSLGKFCGRDVPPPLTSYYGRLVVVFHSDANKNGRGFTATWDTSGQCGDSIDANDGQISFPNINANYPKDSNCYWDIRVDPEYTVALEFNGKYGIETNDKLQVHQMLSAGLLDHPLSYAFSGPVKPSNTLLLPGSHVRLHFQSDSSEQFEGFDLKWSTTCGVDTHIHKSQGTFSSPNYGNEYRPNLDCEWTIHAQDRKLLRLNFDAPFDLESSSNGNCSHDYLEIFDFPNGIETSVGKYCGSQVPPSIVSAFNMLKVRFHTDEDKAGKGFSLSWDTSCGNTYRGKGGAITSPGFPANYPEDFDCRWEIEVIPGNVIRLSFEKTFSLEPNEKCKYDYIQVFDYDEQGQESSLGTWCGSIIPPSLLSSGNKMALTFNSDGAKNYPGFYAQWQAICGEAFQADRGNFSSPSYPRGYPGSLDCQWEISVDAGQRVQLHFAPDFDLELSESDCSYDHVEVLDSFTNGSFISRGKWCSKDQPPTITSFNNRMVIRFHSDVNKNGRGFNAFWTAVPGCGGRFEGGKGYAMSPNYPGSYPNHANCLWEINPSSTANNLTLHFDSLFRLEGGKDCKFDYIQLSAISGRHHRSFPRFCDASAPPDMTFHNETIHIVFQSDKSTQHTGFFLSWSSDES